MTAGNNITLTDNGTDNLPLTANGAFTFAIKLANATNYNLTLSATTPTAQPCTSTYGAGVINAANVTSLNVFCGEPNGPGTFTTTGSMVTARDQYTATLLPNGLVLVSGGYNSTSGYLASAELYDPTNGTWTVTGSMTRARDQHTATLLPNGQVLVSGGTNSAGTLSSAELYDPASGTWTVTGSMTTARDLHTATLLPNGKVLVSGGTDGGTNGIILASAELFDPATGIWTVTGLMTSGRFLHTATLLPSGKLLVSGGGGTSGYLASSEVYF
jgi:hypothetical protein